MGRGARNQYIAATAAGLSVLTSACCYGWITPLLPRLLKSSSELPLSSAQLPWVVSVTELGFLLSYLPAGLLSSLVGRRMMLLSSAPLFTLSWTVVLGWPDAWGLAIARFIQGLSIGVVTTVVPEYLSEVLVAVDSPRLVIRCLYGGVWWLGVLLQYSLGTCASLSTLTYISLLLNVVFCLAFVWQPDTPAFHLAAGDEERATHSLLWFRDGTVDAIKREIDEMKVNLEVNRKATGLRELTATCVDREGLILAGVLAVVRGLSGHSVLVVYATHIFTHSTPYPNTATVVLGVAMLMANLSGVLLCEWSAVRVGRRPLLLFSCLGSLVCHLITGTYFFIVSVTSARITPALGLLPTLSIVCAGVHSACLSPVSSSYTAELFRAPVRDLAASVSTLITTLLVFGTLSIYEPMVKEFGLCANFYLYALTSFVGFVYFYLYAPETKGKSFFQIRKELCGLPVIPRPSEMEPLFSEIDDDIENL